MALCMYIYANPLHDNPTGTQWLVMLSGGLKQPLPCLHNDNIIFTAISIRLQYPCNNVPPTLHHLTTMTYHVASWRWPVSAAVWCCRWSDYRPCGYTWIASPRGARTLSAEPTTHTEKRYTTTENKIHYNTQRKKIYTTTYREKIFAFGPYTEKGAYNTV